MKLRKDYEDEIKVFGLDLVEFQRKLEYQYKREEKITTIHIFGSHGKEKFKMVKRKNKVEVVRKKQAKGKLRGKFEHKKKFAKQFDGACTHEQFLELFTEVMGLPVLYEGIKKRLHYDLGEGVHISIDTWISGPLHGISYVEVENTNPKKKVSLSALVLKYKADNCNPRITRKGTLAITKDLEKGKDLNKCYSII